MNASQIKHLAKGAGFSRALATSQQYILFDDDTDGRCGRCVYIDASILNKFADIKEAEKPDLQYLFHRIKQLRSLAGGLSSHFDPAKPETRVNFVGRAEITYLIRQHTDAEGRPAGVYISDIDLGHFNDTEPGLYYVDEDKGDWSLMTKRRRTITTTRAAVNGLCENAQQAATEILPPLIDSAYGHRKWDKAAGKVSTDDSYTLFYNPPAMYKYGRPLKSMSESTNRRLTAHRLSMALKDAQKRNHKVQWTVHGDGIHTFYEALKLTGAHDLSCHTAIFLSPNEDITKVLPLMQRSKMELHNDVYKVHEDDFISQDAQSGNGRRLQKNLLAMGYDKNVAGAFKDDSNEYVWKKGSMIFGAGGIGAALVATALNPASIVPAVSVGLPMALAYGAKAYYDNSNLAKNALAARLESTKTAVNPHLNPYTSRSEMNRKANDYYKSQGVSFVKRVLGKQI